MARHSVAHEHSLIEQGIKFLEKEGSYIIVKDVPHGNEKILIMVC